ncbi:hypothetical protein [Flavobacterium sp. ZB4P13]|uniref:hypothetical protein n=1 Tax=Flavobacterium sp. ZB4P13 TaxID=3401728 RepID=UPI003AAA8F08
MKKIKSESNIIHFSVGAGMFLWLAIISFLHTFLFIISKYILIIVSVDSLVIFWINEILYLILFALVTWKIFNWIKNSNIDNVTARQILKTSIISLVVIQFLQLVISYYLFDILVEKYAIQLDSYHKATRSGYLQIVQSAREFLLYIVLGVLIYRK